MRTTIFTLSSITVCFGIVGACTQDFDTFKGAAAEGGTASGSGGTGSTSGGTTTSSGGGSSGTTTSSGSSSGGSDFDANVDCTAISGSCYQQAGTCNQKCQTDHAACSGLCDNGGPGKACRADCDQKQTACLAPCKMTCEQCAGPDCRNRCP